MHYGLAGAPSVYQCFINNVLREYLRRYVIVYIDEILNYSEDLPKHVSHVLRKHQLYVNSMSPQSLSWGIYM